MVIENYQQSSFAELNSYCIRRPTPTESTNVVYCFEVHSRKHGAPTANVKVLFFDDFPSPIMTRILEKCLCCTSYLQRSRENWCRDGSLVSPRPGRKAGKLKWTLPLRTDFRLVFLAKNSSCHPVAASAPLPVIFIIHCLIFVLLLQRLIRLICFAYLWNNCAAVPAGLPSIADFSFNRNCVCYGYVNNGRTGKNRS